MTDKKDKKIVKLAIIRKDDADPCPFGLSIDEGCKNAEEVIQKMAPISILGEEATEEEKQELMRANKKLFLWQNTGKRCYYAGKILDEVDAVECNYDSNAPGIQHKGIIGPPHYTKVYNNTAVDGLFSYPLSFYGDGNISRNLYYGIYSLLGKDTNEENFKKFADILIELDTKFDGLDDDVKGFLKRFATKYVNNILFKRGVSDAQRDKINAILRHWKETDEPS